MWSDLLLVALRKLSADGPLLSVGPACFHLGLGQVLLAEVGPGLSFPMCLLRSPSWLCTGLLAAHCCRAV